MRFVSLVAVLGIAALSTASVVACGGTASDDPSASAQPATDDGAAEEIKAAVIDESLDGKTVPITLGKSFTIALSDNASTGYIWSVKSVDKDLGAPKETTVPGDVHKPGSSGLKKFTWSTKSPLDLVGKHTIKLDLNRPWSETSPPAKTFSVTIEIKDGAAASFCGGLIGKTCGSADSYCDYAIAASCGAGDQTGKCDAKPQFCPALVLPVCGCDGKTYNNSCEANRSGASVASSGACAHK
jgi:predicted secreted protein